MWSYTETVLHRGADDDGLIDINLDENQALDDQALDVIGFDLDNTLIKTKSKAKFPKNKQDWEFLYPEIPLVLKKAAKDKTLVIFSNQAGIAENKTKDDDLKDKIDEILKKLNLDIPVYLASAKDEFHKPSPYMFLMAFGRLPVKKFTYVGDAAGRKSDFSAVDRLMAENIESYTDVDVEFLTPEQFFLDSQSEAYNLKGFDPSSYQLKQKNPTVDQIVGDDQQIILLVGPPAAGKSTLSQQLKLKDYQIVNQDELKTKAKVLKTAEDYLKQDSSIVIDKTNPSLSDRQDVYNLANKHKVGVKIVYFDVDRSLAEHLNNVRLLKTGKKISAVVYNTYYSKLALPTADEDDSIEDVFYYNFDPHFKSDISEKIYNLRFS